MNTRLNKFTGPISPGDYPPDVVTTQQDSELQYDCPSDVISFTDDPSTPVVTDTDIDFNFDDYENRTLNGPHDVPEPVGAKNRRNLPVFVADCGESDSSGQSTMDILDFGCFFLLQEVKQKGNEAEIYGEFAYDCPSPGFSGPDPTTVPGPHIIQLYHDSDSNDS